MSFTSLTFLGFLALVCIGSYAIPAKARYVFLLFCSYGFYLAAPGGPAHNLPALGMLLAATALSYLCALGMHRASQKKGRIFFLVLSLTGCLGLLLACKYFGFFAEAFASLTGKAPLSFSLVLPLGISYYTLQTVSYSMDIYRKKYAPEYNPLRYALYVCFFPGIVTGPINRGGEMLPQYKSPALFSYERVSGGLFRVLWGIFKKMVIADNIGLFTALVFSSPGEHSGPEVFLAGLLFAYQLYLDFGGSCDIAIGAAGMMGFTFKENFNRPFAAKSFSDLWRRWHISLTSFFREYLYFPLGGNRAGKLRWLLNTTLVFLISGLWHGASVGYIIWGLANGVILVAAKLLHQPKETLVARIPLYRNQHVRGFFARIGVYCLFAGCLVFFAASLYGTTVGEWFGALFQNWTVLSFRSILPSALRAGLQYPAMAAVLCGTLLIEGIETFAVSSESTIAHWIRRRRFFVRWPLYYLLIATLLVFGVFGKSAFIYQQY